MNERTSREHTRPVQVGNLTIGGNNELTIQSMTTTKTH
ncbi:4-hydroxy-3-methylbut-2-en-1-yl diphosphate synthase, partial [Listeria marthii FSL S4-120]